jgi:hypothetical protein
MLYNFNIGGHDVMLAGKWLILDGKCQFPGDWQ